MDKILLKSFCILESKQHDAMNSFSLIKCYYILSADFVKTYFLELGDHMQRQFMLPSKTDFQLCS